MGKVKQITANLAGVEGAVPALAEALAGAGVRLLGLLFEGDRVRIIPDDPEGALAALRDAGIEGWLGNALSVEMSDDATAFSDLLEKLGRAGVVVEAAYTGPPGRGTRTWWYLTVSDLESSLKVTGGGPDQDERGA
jgi:hypothetical protein